MVFYECASLQHIVIPPTVKVMRYGAFSSCSRLMALQLGEGLEKIEGDAFSRCTSLQHVVIPRAVEAIEHETFLYCSRLTTVQLCDGLKEIKASAFSGCTSSYPRCQGDRRVCIRGLLEFDDCAA
jgi:hypothetical protein